MRRPDPRPPRERHGGRGSCLCRRYALVPIAGLTPCSSSLRGRSTPRTAPDRGRSALIGRSPMSAATLTANAPSDAHRAFEAALGRIDAALRYQFRRLPRDEREEAVAEARAYTWAAWLGLIRRGKDPVDVGVVAIADNCCRAVKNGRSVGARRSTGRGAMDIHHPKARRATGLRVVSLEELAGLPSGGWRDWLASDDRYGPADEAIFRVDFAAWLARLPERRRRAAELLAEGLGTGAVARRLGVTPGAVSQAREWLARSWGQFQADADAV